MEFPGSGDFSTPRNLGRSLLKDHAARGLLPIQGMSTSKRVGIVLLFVGLVAMAYLSDRAGGAAIIVGAMAVLADAAGRNARPS